MFSKRSPVGSTRSGVTDRFPGRQFQTANRVNLAPDQVAQELLDLGALAGVLFLGNRTGLLTKLQAEYCVFQGIEAGANLRVHIGDAVRWRGLGGFLGRLARRGGGIFEFRS